MLSTPPSAPHELCLSSASADRYEGHGTREYALAAEHARRRSSFQKGYEEGTPRQCVCPAATGSRSNCAPNYRRPRSLVPRVSRVCSVPESNNQDLQCTSDSFEEEAYTTAHATPIAKRR